MKQTIQPEPAADSYRALFRDSPEPVWIVETAGLRLLEMNRAAEEFTGFSQSEFAGKTVLDLVQPWDLEKFKAALEAGDFASREFCGIAAFTASGQPRDVDLLIAPTEFVGQSAWVVTLANAAPRLQLEEQLQQARKMESVGMLAGGIAHDFNNLLTIISGYSHMLLAALPQHDEKNRSAAEQLIKASDRAAALTRQLLAFSRQQILQAKVLDLNALVQGMTPMLRRLIGENIDLRIAPSDDLGHIHADAGQVEQVVMNLVVNARDAMPSGGKLLIETHNVELGEHWMGTHLTVKPGFYIMLGVSDTGIGMDQATRERVFDPFFTTKEVGRGTGLGLSTVMSVVKRSGGSVGVYSEPGHGTTVKIYFPRAGQSELAPVQAAQQEPLGGWETVLVVEDEEEVRTLVKTALDMRGYNVLVAADGGEAMRVSKQHSGPVHLLVTDLIMPDVNGREVARKLHRKRPEMAVLFMSGYTDSSLRNNSSLHPSLHFLSKPFSPAALARKVREVLDEMSGGTERRRHARS